MSVPTTPASSPPASSPESSASATPEPWDDAFDCRMCGQCCQGEGGIVVSPADLSRICAFLGMTPQAFEAAYGERSNGKLKVRTGPDGNCVFFAAGRGCTVHEGKPDICRAWPFFRGNLVDAGSLAMAKEYCPGIRPGVRHAEFAAAGRAYLAARGLLASDCTCEANALVLERDEDGAK